MTENEAGQITRIEATVHQLAETVTRLERLISDKIADLKNEQIADLRTANIRLADDQRRAWEAIRELEADSHKSHGRTGAFQALMSVVASLLSGGLVALVVHSLH